MVVVRVTVVTRIDRPRMDGTAVNTARFRRGHGPHGLDGFDRRGHRDRRRWRQ
jgi:hypothetical protein